VRRSSGIAHRAPNSYERDFADGISQSANPSLKGESIDTLELDADQRIGHDLTLRASLYQWRMQDLITLGIDQLTGLSQYQTGTGVKARGLELSADRTWDHGARLRGSVSTQNVAYEDGRELLNSPRLLGKLDLSQPLPFARLRAGYEWQYDSKRLTLNGTSLGGYGLSNLILSTDILASKSLLSLGAYNLFDKRYAQPGSATNWQNAFEQDGLSVQLKLMYHF
jgi:iron complex outermembrane receptor protein